MQYVESVVVESRARAVTRPRSTVRTRFAAGVAIAATVLAGCSGGSGADVETNAGSGPGPTVAN